MRPRVPIAIVVVAATLFSGCVQTAASPNDTELSVPGQHESLICNATIRGIDLQEATILDLQEALAKGRITSVELVRAYIARIEALDNLPLNPAVPVSPDPVWDGAEHYVSLNSIRVLNPNALAWAEQRDAERKAGLVLGPMHGIPILLKDNIGTSDVPTTAGSIALATNVPEDSTQVQNLIAAGAIILGKAELAEFANWMSTQMPNGYSSIGGQVMNAYTGRNPSGSSSGSGVAASMAFSAATIGSETSGSIIGPSSSNSVVGLKPTMGIVSRYGVVPLAASFDMTGPMVRNVEDAAIMLGAMVSAEVDKNDPASAVPPNLDFTRFLSPDALKGVNVGYAPYTNNAANRNFTRALDVMRALGADVQPIDSNLNAASNVYLGTFGVVSNEFKNGINDYLTKVAGSDLPIDHLAPVTTPREVRSLGQIIVYNQQHPDQIPYGQQFLMASETQPGDPVTALAGGLAVREASKAVADQMFDKFDVIVGNGFGFYGMGTAAGYPSLTVPAGYGNLSGRPVSPQSITFTAPGFQDAELLGYAYAFEQATHYRVRPEYQNATLLQSVCSPGAVSASVHVGSESNSADDYDPMADLPRLPNGKRVPLI
jgi:amidase